jgi:hypothetical protein
MVHNLEEICVLRIACKSGAQIFKVKISVIRHQAPIKRPSGHFSSVTRCDKCYISWLPPRLLPVQSSFPVISPYGLPPILFQTLSASTALFSSIFLTPMSRYTSFHPPRNPLPLSPCTSPDTVKYRYHLLGILQCTHWGPWPSEHRRFRTKSS